MKPTETIAFRKVREPFGWFSNMSPHPVQGYRTAEAFFQALRFSATERAIIEEIKAATSPMGAKMIAKKYVDRMVIKPRSEDDINLMRVVLRAKVNEHPDLRKQLLETGHALIIEDVSKRPNESGLFWGAQLIAGSWEGQNWLGHLWMVLRETLRREDLAESLKRRGLQP